MEKLIETKTSAIVYGENNEEQFRCPIELEDKDLRRYINQYRKLVQSFDEIPFIDDDTEDLRNVEGKELIGYFRMYYRNGWAGRWMLENGEPTKLDCYGVQHIVDYICSEFSGGCDHHMKYFMESEFKPWGCEQRYLLHPFLSDYYKVMIDTTYGNGDYPVRIYAYRDKGVM